MSRKLLFPLLLAAVVLLVLSRDRGRTNEEYLDSLATRIVIPYQNRHGEPPKDFEEAHAESGIELSHRGDRNGNVMIYFPFTSDAFMIRSQGPNHKDDKGRGDDMDVYYLKQKKVDRATFLNHLRASDPAIRGSAGILFGEDLEEP